MKKSQLQQIIREEVHNALQEKTSKLRLAVREHVRHAINELSPELARRAGDKAKEDPRRRLQANKFYQYASDHEYMVAQADRNAKLNKVEPFIGKNINLYYNAKDYYRGSQFEYQGITVPYTIGNINLDIEGIYGIQLKRQEPIDNNFFNMLPIRCYMAYNPEDDSIRYDATLIGNGVKLDEPQYYAIAGFDMAGAQLITKIAKAINPDSKITPNTTGMALAEKAFYPAPFPKKPTI